MGEQSVREQVDRVDGHAVLERIIQAYFDSRHAPSETDNIDAPEGDLLDELKALGYME